MAGTGRKISLFPGGIQGTGREISLREGLYKLFRGDGLESGKAHWVILRHFDKTRKSSYWNDDTKEAVGGPAWEYGDTPTLTYSALRPPIGFGTEMSANIPLMMGKMDDIHVLYFFEHDVSIDQDDVIFEVSWSGINPPSDLAALTYTKRYNVKYVFQYRADDQGRIEFQTATCRVDDVSWG
jgi:hypothetical protein